MPATPVAAFTWIFSPCLHMDPPCRLESNWSKAQHTRPHRACPCHPAQRARALQLLATHFRAPRLTTASVAAAAPPLPLRLMGAARIRCISLVFMMATAGSKLPSIAPTDCTTTSRQSLRGWARRTAPREAILCASSSKLAGCSVRLSGRFANTTMSTQPMGVFGALAPMHQKGAFQCQCQKGSFQCQCQGLRSHRRPHPAATAQMRRGLQGSLAPPSSWRKL